MGERVLVVPMVWGQQRTVVGGRKKGRNVRVGTCERGGSEYVQDEAGLRASEAAGRA